MKYKIVRNVFGIEKTIETGLSRELAEIRASLYARENKYQAYRIVSEASQ